MDLEKRNILTEWIVKCICLKTPKRLLYKHTCSNQLLPTKRTTMHVSKNWNHVLIQKGLVHLSSTLSIYFMEGHESGTKSCVIYSFFLILFLLLSLIIFHVSHVSALLIWVGTDEVCALASPYSNTCLLLCLNLIRFCKSVCTFSSLLYIREEESLVFWCVMKFRYLDINCVTPFCFPSNLSLLPCCSFCFPFFQSYSFYLYNFLLFLSSFLSPFPILSSVPLLPQMSRPVQVQICGHVMSPPPPSCPVAV